MKTTNEAKTWTPGTRVCAGAGEGYEEGTVHDSSFGDAVEHADDAVWVSWDGGSRTWTPADLLTELSPAAQLGKLGGASRSEAKTDAARANGAKGGRPKKYTHRLIEQGNGLDGLEPGALVYSKQDNELLVLVGEPSPIHTDHTGRGQGNYVFAALRPSRRDVTDLSEAELGALPRVRVEPA